MKQPSDSSDPVESSDPCQPGKCTLIDKDILNVYTYRRKSGCGK